MSHGSVDICNTVYMICFVLGDSKRAGRKRGYPNIEYINQYSSSTKHIHTKPSSASDHCRNEWDAVSSPFVIARARTVPRTHKVKVVAVLGHDSWQPGIGVMKRLIPGTSQSAAMPGVTRVETRCGPLIHHKNKNSIFPSFPFPSPSPDPYQFKAKLSLSMPV